MITVRKLPFPASTRLAALSLSAFIALIGAAVMPCAFAAPTPTATRVRTPARTPTATRVRTPVRTPTPMPTTFAGLVLHCRILVPFTIPAGATFHNLCHVQGTLPNAAQYGVVGRAIVYAKGGATDTTCLVELSDGAAFGTPVTVPAHTTVSIPFEDSGPGFPLQKQIVAITIQAGTGGPLTILPNTSVTLEAVASKPGNNAY
jgi:hypothetical protein